jgi:hypothetical protein
MKKFKLLVSLTLVLTLIISVIVVAPINVGAVANTWNPSAGVYDISTEEDLFAFKDSLDNNAHYESIEVNLINDIVVSEGHTYVSPNSNGDAGAQFCGTFNGKNHTISNLDMVSSNDDTVSFLPFLKNATIKDLTLKDVKIENGKSLNAAFACESMGENTITNCHLKGDCVIKPSDDFPITQSTINSGLIAYIHDGTVTIDNCSVGDGDSNIKISNPGVATSRTNIFSGGIVGFADCDTSLDIRSTENYAYIGGDAYTGGIVGAINGDTDCDTGAKIIDCRNYGNIISTEDNTSGYSNCGGIVGYEAMEAVLVIDRCANYGDISINCESYCENGGVAAFIGCGAVINSYNTGKITGVGENTTLGGVVGHFRVNDGAQVPGSILLDYYPTECLNSIINCYNVGDVIGDGVKYVGGVCGYVQDFYTVDTRSVIKNAYNFATVSGVYSTGMVCGAVQDTTVSDIYGLKDSYALRSIEIHDESHRGVEEYISNVGYFDTPDVNGTVYPATVIANGIEVNNEITENISSAPLTGNLLNLLNEKVNEYNVKLEASGSDFRYLTWKMTNPASEDGSKGVTVHPMFGVEELKTLKFHVNQPDVTEDKLFRVYNAEKPADFAKITEDGAAHSFNNKGGVDEFYNIPKFAEDEYVFAGWYTVADNYDNSESKAFEFNTAVPSDVTDVYAHWIPVGKVDKDDDDDKELPSSMNDKYKGFDLCGVQIRPKKNYDYNYEEEKEVGLRFVASISESLLSKINAVHTDNKIEYGFVSASDDMVKAVVNKSDMNIDKDSYTLQYNGKNVNGVDTTDKTLNPNNFRYITNVDCTSKVGGYGSNPNIKLDHRNFTDYRLASYVVTYDDDGTNKDKNVAARAYLRYTDANGLLRTFYNNYSGTNFYGGCSTNYTDVEKNMATNTKTVKN